MTLRAVFRHVGAFDHPAIVDFEGDDAGALMLEWQTAMERLKALGFRTLTCVCYFL